MLPAKAFLNKYVLMALIPEGNLFGQYKTWTAVANYGLRTGYKILTRYKTRTGKYGLGIKPGLGIKRGLQTADWV